MNSSSPKWQRFTSLELPGTSRLELENLAVKVGLDNYRGRQIYNWIYRRRVFDLAEMTDLGIAARAILQDHIKVVRLNIIEAREGMDGSRKLLFQLEDGARVEAVSIPEGERLTACLSSQVGCQVGCQFCATGRIGFKRNLTAGEIIAQLFAMERVADRPMTNIVMMGMGEPLLNRNNLFRAVSLLTDRNGIALSPRRITVSTAGWIPGIEAMTREKLKVKLAVSLNGTTEDQRRRLMPLAAKYPLPEILNSVRAYGRQSGGRPAISYLLLEGFNDSVADANRLATFAHRCGAKVNLMEYNDVGVGAFSRTRPEITERFIRILSDKAVTVTLRTSRGRDITAACGQLAGKYDDKTGIMTDLCASTRIILPSV